MLYELLTGRKPFSGDNLTAISYKIVHEDFTPPAELSSDVPPEFNPIVARAMAKDPWNRYQRGKDLALALQQLRAHLEEQKALQELGTVVSSAESMATLKLTNIRDVVADARATSPPPPAVAGVAPPSSPASTPAAPPAAARPAGSPSSPTPAPSGPAAVKAQPAAKPGARPAPGPPATAQKRPAGTGWPALAKRSIHAPRFWMIAGG